MSGFIPRVEGWSLDTARPFPQIAIAHGLHDQVIPVSFGRAARDTLVAAGADVLYREYPLQHAIDPRFLDEVRPLVAG
jgi:phospholipase/carboxylesterase